MDANIAERFYKENEKTVMLILMNWNDLLQFVELF